MQPNLICFIAWLEMGASNSQKYVVMKRYWIRHNQSIACTSLKERLKPLNGISCLGSILFHANDINSRVIPRFFQLHEQSHTRLFYHFLWESKSFGSRYRRKSTYIIFEGFFMLLFCLWNILMVTRWIYNFQLNSKAVRERKFGVNWVNYI